MFYFHPCRNDLIFFLTLSCVLVPCRNLLGIPHSSTMVLRKAARGSRHLWNVDPQISQNFHDDLNVNFHLCRPNLLSIYQIIFFNKSFVASLLCILEINNFILSSLGSHIISCQKHHPRFSK